MGSGGGRRGVVRAPAGEPHVLDLKRSPIFCSLGVRVARVAHSPAPACRGANDMCLRPEATPVEFSPFQGLRADDDAAAGTAA